mgnify:CR=1 FL=1
MPFTRKPPGTGSAPAGFAVVQRFPNSPTFTPGEARLPVSLSDGQNLATTGPDQIKGQIQTDDGTKVTDVDPDPVDGGPSPGFAVDVLEWATCDAAGLCTPDPGGP